MNDIVSRVADMGGGLEELTPETKVCEIHGEYLANGQSIFGRAHWSPCPECEKERRAKENEEAKKQKAIDDQKRLNKFYKASGIIKRYQGLTLETFEPVENQLDALKMAKAFCDRFDEMAERGQTIVFCGNLGTGKTRLASAIIQTLGFGRYIRAVDISRDIRATYSGNTESEREVIEYFVNQPILIIDEVGVQSGTDNERMLLTDIIDRRYGEMHPTVICSNLNEPQLAKAFGERAWDRLKQQCLICPMVGESLRKGDLG